MNTTNATIDRDMMDKNEQFDLEKVVLQRLEGKMSLMLTGVEREALVKASL